MVILGISNAETSSACIMIDGEVVAAASEERFSRIKMDSNFPLKSVEFCLKFANIHLSKVNIIAYAWAKGFNKELLNTYLERATDFVSEHKAKKVFTARID